MGIEITTGKQKAPIRAVLYGPEGIGKSTLASAFPAPVFIDVEGGTLRLDVARVQPTTWAGVEQAIGDIAKMPQYKTIVFDTADWCEKMLAVNVCQEHKQAGIESFGFGKGFTFLAEGFKRFLDALQRVQNTTGKHVVWTAHAAMRKFEQPDEAGSYDRWEMKLSKTVTPILKEWADLVLFLNYRTMVVEIDGKHKAQGGQRVMFSTHHPCWDAKNRFGLPDEMPMEWKRIAHIIDDVFAKSEVKKPAPAPTPETKDDLPMGGTKAPEPAKPETPKDFGGDPEKAGLLAQLADLMRTSEVTKEQLGKELARKGVLPADTNPRDYNVPTLKRVIAGWSAITNNIKNGAK